MAWGTGGHSGVSGGAAICVEQWTGYDMALGYVMRQMACTCLIPMALCRVIAGRLLAYAAEEM